MHLFNHADAQKYGAASPLLFNHVINYTFKIVNGDDTPDNAVIFAATAATCTANDIASVSALSAEVTDALAATAQALAIVNKNITAAQKRKIAMALLNSAGDIPAAAVAAGTASMFAAAGYGLLLASGNLPSAMQYASSNAAGVIKAKGSLDDKEKLWHLIYGN